MRDDQLGFYGNQNSSEKSNEINAIGGVVNKGVETLAKVIEKVIELRAASLGVEAAKVGLQQANTELETQKQKNQGLLQQMKGNLELQVNANEHERKMQKDYIDFLEKAVSGQIAVHEAIAGNINIKTTILTDLSKLQDKSYMFEFLRITAPESTAAIASATSQTFFPPPRNLAINGNNANAQNNNNNNNNNNGPEILALPSTSPALTNK